MNINYLESAFNKPASISLAAFKPSMAIAALVLLTACTTEKVQLTSAYTYLPNKTLSATGYGTVEKSDKYSRSQIKLMAMRASKMDAYRSLAEQLNGMQLRSHTSVDNMQVTQDSYQIFVDAFLQGARVKRTSAIGTDTYAGDDTFETVVELDLTPRFYECINGSSALINQCLQQNTGTPAPSFNQNVTSVSSASSGCNTIDCYNYPKSGGFSRK
jgi:hypothetical protein